MLNRQTYKITGKEANKITEITELVCSYHGDLEKATATLHYKNQDNKLCTITVWLDLVVQPERLSEEDPRLEIVKIIKENEKKLYNK